MAVIGITGSIASGKTALLEYLENSKYPTFSCDQYVKTLYRDENVVQKIIKNFPEFELLNKNSLAKIIYSDSVKRQRLEKILHPLVAKGLEEFLANNYATHQVSLEQKLGSRSKSAPHLFLEIPLLFEAGWEKYCDYIITLCCPKEIRLQRGLERGLSKEMFDAIDKTQMHEELKVQKSHFIINTNVNWEEEITEFERVMDTICKAPRETVVSNSS